VVFRIVVELRGAVLAETVADRPRLDLQRNGFGNGAYGFAAQFPAALSYAELEMVEVFAIGPNAERRTLNRLLRHTTGFEPNAEDTDARPVFVLGSRRSGTSACAHALLQSTRYRGPYEGHLFDLLPQLNAAVKNFYRLKTDLINDPKAISLLVELPPGFFDNALADIFRQLASKIFGIPFWLDKTPTPDMVRAAPLLAKIWPNARFIFMRRRAFENLLSQQRKFPHERFEDYCKWWSSCMSAWVDVRRDMGGRAIEIDQYLLARDPDLSATLIADFLALEPDERTKMSNFLTKRRPERTEPELDTIETGPGAKWTDQQKQFFDETCLPLFARFGYAENGDYFISRDASLAWRKI
jgi:hypothetical protein